jgi:NitT/TauT family transport system permease protein
MTIQTQTGIDRKRLGVANPLARFAAKLGRSIFSHASVIFAFLAFFLFWEVAARLAQVPAFILPLPSAIAVRLVQNWSMLLINSLTTLEEIVLGFGLSIAFALGLAILVVSNRTVEKLVMPFVVALKTIPKIALAPILIIWFGYGLMPKVAIAFLISFFPILVSAIIGLKSADQEMIYLARSMRATTMQTFVKIRFPNALPEIFGGLRVGVVQAVTGAIVGEYLASENGLGYLQLVAQSRMDTVLLFSSVMVLSVLGVLLFEAIVVAERIFMPWAAERE